MRIFKALCIVSALLVEGSLASSQPLRGAAEDALRRAAIQIENWRLEEEIGRFTTGRQAVYSGRLEVLQHDRHATRSASGHVIASLVSGSGPRPDSLLTIVFPDEGLWLRLSQSAEEPHVTYVSRLLPVRATVGVQGSCATCAAILNARPDQMLFIRLAATGKLLDNWRSRFQVSISGRLERVSPGKLQLEQLALLGPNMESQSTLHKMPFEVGAREARRPVAQTVRIPVPSAADAPPQTSCDVEARYRAEHFVDLWDLTRFGVRDLEIVSTRVCCTDNDSHTGARTCQEETR